MIRYKAKIAYDGTHYQGYQVQPHGRTIQGSIEKGLTKMAKNQFIRIHGSGRTDAGVHAREQVIHFDLPFAIQPQGILKGLNAQLSTEIRIMEVAYADKDFHARYDVLKKEYTYLVDLKKVQDPFLRNYACHHPYPLDLNKMNQASQYMLGEHDFSAFSSQKSDVLDRVRTLFQIRLHENQDEGLLYFSFIGNGFLYNMVRILVGTLLACGDGRIKADSIPHIFKSADRAQAGPTAPAQGLCLEKVYY